MANALNLGEPLKAELSRLGSVESILQELTQKHGVTIDRSRVLAILHPRGLPAFAELGVQFTLRALQRLDQELQAVLRTTQSMDSLEGLDVPTAADLERAVASAQGAITRLRADHPDLGTHHLPNEHESPVDALQRASYVRQRSAVLYDHLATAIPSPMPQRQPVGHRRRHVPITFNSTALHYTVRLVNAEFWPAVTLTVASLKSHLQHRAAATTKSI